MAIDSADRKFKTGNQGARFGANQPNDPTGGGGSDPVQDFIDKISGGPADTVEEEFDEVFFWQDAVVGKIQDDIKAVSKKFDMDLDYLNGWFEGQKVNLLNHLQSNYLDVDFGDSPITRQHDIRALDPNNPGDVQHLFNAARLWVGQFFPGFRDAINLKAPSGSGRRGSSGRRRPSAAEIRAQFDVDELTDVVNQMSRAFLVEEADDARAIAKSYVDAIVGNPEQKLDFETFARKRLLAKPKAKVIYQNKPEGLSEEQFLQPFVQAAQQRIGPGFGDQLQRVATGGARLGASPQAFQQRLERTRQVQTSTPFLSKLGERMNNFAGVLR